MSSKRVRYGQLYSYLESLGYRPEAGPTYFVYRNPGTRLPIFLPKRPKTEEASNFNVLSVQHTLELEDVVEPGHLLYAIIGAPKVKSRAAKPRATDKAAGTKAAKPKTAKANVARPKATGTRAAKARGS
jgi:hypothetical protein